MYDLETRQKFGLKYALGTFTVGTQALITNDDTHGKATVVVDRQELSSTAGGTWQLQDEDDNAGGVKFLVPAATISPASDTEIHFAAGKDVEAVVTGTINYLVAYHYENRPEDKT